VLSLRGEAEPAQQHSQGEDGGGRAQLEALLVLGFLVLLLALPIACRCSPRARLCLKCRIPAALVQTRCSTCAMDASTIEWQKKGEFVAKVVKFYISFVVLKESI
jgi:hypothetical protein